MPSIVEFSELSKASYGDEIQVSFPHPPVAIHVRPPIPLAVQTPMVPMCQAPDADAKFYWKRTDFRKNHFGFFAARYDRPGGGVVLAFRGTDDFWDGLLDDKQIAVGGVPPQVFAACDAVRSLGLGSQAYLTGHSLGGALALIVAAREGLPAVTFNAPGVMDSCVRAVPHVGGRRGFLDMAGRCMVNPRVINKRIDKDLVSSVFTTGLQVGTTQSYPATHCGLDALCRHGIDTCVDEVRKEAANYRSLDL